MDFPYELRSISKHRETCNYPLAWALQGEKEKEKKRKDNQKMEARWWSLENRCHPSLERMGFESPSSERVHFEGARRRKGKEEKMHSERLRRKGNEKNESNK